MRERGWSQAVGAALAALVAAAILAGCARDEAARPSERTGGGELPFRDAVPVALLILDKSSSMENTLDENGTLLAEGNDPENFQADAAKEFIHLASFLASDPERDVYPLVGVVAFSSRAELLSAPGADGGLVSLREPGATAKLAAAIDRLGRDGWHTDINAALGLALERFAQLDRAGGRAVRPLTLLLTDGGLWPFPCDEANYPNAREASRGIGAYKAAYRDAYGKDPLPSPPEAGVRYEDDSDAIEKRHVRPLQAYARMRLLDQVAPEFRKRAIPLCCVPLGETAQELLTSVCKAGNRESTQNRYLAVDDPADLPERFTDVITSWLGIARYVGTGSFHVDETVGAVSFIVRFRPRLKSADAADRLVTLTAPGDVAVGPDTKAGGMTVSVRSSAKSKLYFVNAPTPGLWTVAVAKDPALAPPDLRVRYEYLFKSKVRMVVSGIAPSYSLNTPKLEIAVSFVDVAKAKDRGSAEGARLSLPATFAALALEGTLENAAGERVAALAFEPLDGLAAATAMRGAAAIGALEPGPYTLTVRAAGRFRARGAFLAGGELTVRTRSFRLVIEEGIVVDYVTDGESRSRVPFGSARRRSRAGR